MTAGMRSVDVFRILTGGPGDVSGLIALIESGRLDPHGIVAILGKTEGNGGVNDFTRAYAVVALRACLSRYLECSAEEVEARIAFVMSGGTEGVLSPHLTVFVRTGSGPLTSVGGKRLSVGIARTRDFLPEEIGRLAQIEETASAVKAAMRDAGIDEPADIHYVQVKCPLLTSERIEAAHGRGRDTATVNAYESMAYSRGASSLGVALALGEIDGPLRDEQVLNDWARFSSVASASAGIELSHNVIIAMGNSAVSTSPFVIGHAVMRDAIDLDAIAAAFESVGIEPAVGSGSRQRLVNVFAKAEAAPEGYVRGFRHTMLEDSDIGSTRHARAAVGGLIGGLAGTGAVYVSGGAEHQGPPGGGPIAVIARV